MRLQIEARVSERRGGMAATAPRLGLTGHGVTEEEAMASLRDGVAAWTLGLSLAGALDEALARRGVLCADAEAAGLSVDLRQLHP